MRMRIWTLLVVVSFVAVLDAVQRDRAAIGGVVTDEGSAPLPGAVVEISGPEHRSAVTNERGEFQFANLLPGTYQLTFSLPGMTTAIQRVTVGPGKTERLAVRLRVGTLAETVSVTSESPRVQAQMSTSVRADWPGRRWRYRGPMNTESYDSFEDNPFHRVTTDPLSTFSIDVDTASYANTRRMLNDGELPPPGAVRIEEFINYFRFDYPQPEGRRALLGVDRAGRLPVECRTSPRAHRTPGAGDQTRIHAAPQSRVPHRRLRIDGRSRQAAARPKQPADAGRHSGPAGLGGDRGLCRVERARAAGHAGRSTDGDPHRDRESLGWRFDQRRRGHPPRVPPRAGTLRRRRCQPCHPRHRRRLQRRRHERGRARPVDREGARVGRVSVGPRRRHRQLSGLDDGEAGRQRERQLLLSRLHAGSAQSAGPGSERARW